MLVHTTLDAPEYQIIEAADGDEALKLARQEKPDLVVLDWMMPGLPGIEVTRLLRKNAETARLPIVMLTAKGQERDKLAGRALGVTEYLVKPFSPLEFA